MRKNLFFISFMFFFHSCTDYERNDNVDIQQIKGLKKGTYEYNLGILKIYEFDSNKGYINEKLAKDLGFSSEQIKEFKKEINNNNIFIQEEIKKGSKVEHFNTENLSPEEFLNQNM